MSIYIKVKQIIYFINILIGTIPSKTNFVRVKNQNTQLYRILHIKTLSQNNYNEIFLNQTRITKLIEI